MPPEKSRKRVREDQEAPDPESVEAEGLLSMDQAIEMLKTTRSTFYRWLRGGKIKGMKVGRQWRFYKEDLERFLKGEEPRIEVPADPGPLLETLEGLLEKFGEAPGERSDEPVADAVNRMIRVAAAAGASDLHLEVHEDGGRMRVRVDGVLREVAEYDGRLHPAIIARWKTLAACDVHQNRLPQDGRIILKLDEAPEGIDIRCCFVPMHFGEALTARLLMRERVRLDLERLDLPPRQQEILEKHIEGPWGLIPVVGPTGCGKTTTLYSSLAHLNRPEVKILSIEDPVEYVIGGLVQIQIRQKEGLTFERAIRSMLRSDPDVMMIGEVRSLEVLQLAFQSALTGHLVMTTLHTDDAALALKRMVDMGADPFLASDATRLVMAQRLVRRLCPDCAEPGEPDANAVADARELARAGGVAWEDLAKTWHRPVGCEKCRLTGYRGRTIIAELLEISGEVGAAVRRGADPGEVRTIGVGQGMTTMGAHAVLRAAAGETSLTEALRLAPRV